jgi:hypothetical protein
MAPRQEGTRYSVRLSVPRRGGWRAWGAASGNFERRLAEQESAAIIAPHIEDETRRGRDYVRVTVVMTIGAPDIAQALTPAWWVFRRAAGSDAAGWDMASATAEVRPEERLTRHVSRAGCSTQVPGTPHGGEPHLRSLIHTDTWAGSRAWCTTPARSSRTESRSTASFKRAANAATVWSAS